MSRIHCPNIVMYVESGMAKSRDVYWIVMEFLSGESLDKYLERNGPMSEVEAIRVSPKQIAFHLIILNISTTHCSAFQSFLEIRLIALES